MLIEHSFLPAHRRLPRTSVRTTIVAGPLPTCSLRGDYGALESSERAVAPVAEKMQETISQATLSNAHRTKYPFKRRAITPDFDARQESAFQRKPSKRRFLSLIHI